MHFWLKAKVPWHFRSWERKFHVIFVPQNESSKTFLLLWAIVPYMELSLPGAKLLESKSSCYRFTYREGWKAELTYKPCTPKLFFFRNEVSHSMIDGLHVNLTQSVTVGYRFIITLNCTIQLYKHASAYSHIYSVVLKSARSANNANSAVNSWPHTVCRRPRVRSIARWRLLQLAKHHIFGLFRTSYRRKLQAFANDRTVRTARTI